MFIAALFTVAKTWKQMSMSFAATWMQLEIIILSEVSQKEKDKYYITYI